MFKSYRYCHKKCLSISISNDNANISKTLMSNVKILEIKNFESVSNVQKMDNVKMLNLVSKYQHFKILNVKFKYSKLFISSLYWFLKVYLYD